MLIIHGWVLSICLFLNLGCMLLKKTMCMFNLLLYVLITGIKSVTNCILLVTGFPQCPRRGSSRGHDSALRCHRCQRWPSPHSDFTQAQDHRPPKNAEAGQTGDWEAYRRRGPPAPRGRPCIVTVYVGKHGPRSAAAAGWLPNKFSHRRGARRGRPNGPVTCTLPPPTMAAAASARSIRHPDPLGPSQAAAAAPPQGHAAPLACSPHQAQRPNPLDLGSPS